MKYIILIGDGMSDHNLEALGGKTPLEFAKTPNMDAVVSNGAIGLFNSVPEGYPPGSDVANLSILGYDPSKYYTGRAPLEAANIGIDLAPADIAFRCNLVSLDGEGAETIMADYSAGHITTEEAAEIIKTLANDEELSNGGIRFHAGKSYRHLMVYPNGPVKLEATPPHDISDKVISPHLPKGEGADTIVALMERSRVVLKDHPVNIKRREAGKNTADSIWLWGNGKAPKMETYKERFGKSGAIISAVDLLNGIGVYAGLEVINVPGVTGYLDTNYTGKAEYAIEALKHHDFVCVHVEAPDEAGHQGLIKEKVQAIEEFDELVVGHILKKLSPFAPYRVMVITDHPTPVLLKTHTREAVPFALFESGDGISDAPTEVDLSITGQGFSEFSAKQSGVYVEEADDLIGDFFKN